MIRARAAAAPISDIKHIVLTVPPGVEDVWLLATGLFGLLLVAIALWMVMTLWEWVTNGR